MPQYLSIASHRVAYRTYGRGPRVLIGFHGFGRDGSAFAVWENVLGDHYTILAADLPFHGKTRWASERFTPADIAAIVHGLWEVGGGKPYILVGHSLGGRLSASSLSELDPAPEQLWLLAPDGLATRRLNTLERIPAWLKAWLGRQMTRRPERWINLSQRLYRLGWVDRLAAQYLEYQLANSESRQRLAGVWMSLPQFPFSSDQLTRDAGQQNVAIEVIFGASDPLIDAARAAAQLPAIPVHQLPQGHRLITAATARWLKEKLAD